MEQIQDNLAIIQRRIHAAAASATRSPDSIRLIAVSKHMPPESLSRAMAAGQFCFGENYLQEAVQKQAQLHDERIEWHFIGHLQTNKAKQAAGKFSWLHTMDNLKLADKLAAAMTGTDLILNVLLQVNVANDPGKSGIPARNVLHFAEALLEAEHRAIRLCGLMTIGRQHANKDERRADFASLRRLSELCGDHLGKEYFTELSMGMSDDFELAIQEGSTMLRIGSAIFGARPPVTPKA
jgi:pyridoxal phosphate enzyme (YggS family)